MTKPTGFHAHDGWWFKRSEDGTVSIEKRNGIDENIVSACIDLDKNSWASVVASVSKRGETTETYDGALAFHMHEPKPVCKVCTGHGYLLDTNGGKGEIPNWQPIERYSDKEHIDMLERDDVIPCPKCNPLDRGNLK